MRLTFLGKDTQGGGSPTLYATDRDTYVVQRWKVPGQGTSVEIPNPLLRFLEPDTTLAATLSETGRDSFILSGQTVTDAGALAQMDIPGHETCIEIGKVREGDAHGVTSG